MSPEKSEPLDPHAILEHTKVIWLIRTSLLRNQRHYTYLLYWSTQRSCDWSAHLLWETRHCTYTLCWSMQKSFDFWDIRGTALTIYVKTYNGHLTDQNISSEKLQVKHSLPMLEHAKVIWLYLFWKITDNALTNYVGACKGHLTDQNILSEKSETLHSLPMLEHTQVIWLIKTFFWEIRDTALTTYIRTCKGYLTNQNISGEKSKTLHSLPMLEYAKVIWMIRTFFLRNQRHCTYLLY